MMSKYLVFVTLAPPLGTLFDAAWAERNRVAQEAVGEGSSDVGGGTQFDPLQVDMDFESADADSVVALVTAVFGALSEGWAVSRVFVTQVGVEPEPEAAAAA